MKRADRFAKVLAALIFGFAGPLHAAKYKIHWLIGHQDLDYFEEAAKDFKSTVEKGSHGEIEVHITTAARDSSDISARGLRTPEIAAKVAKGEAEMGHSFTDVIGSLDPRFWIFEVPYLFRDYRHMEGFFEGPLGAELLHSLLAQNIVGLSFTYSGGANGVATMDREIRRPADLKGLKVGVYGDPVNEAWLKDVGAMPVAIGHNREIILPLARENLLDAVVITWRNFERTSLNRSFKYFNLAGSTYLVSVTYINEKFFNDLPEAYRALIREASHETGRIERAKTIELNESAKRVMLARGVRPVYPTQTNRNLLIRALGTTRERSIEKLIGKDFIEAVKNTADGPSFPSIPSQFAYR